MKTPLTEILKRYDFGNKIVNAGNYGAGRINTTMVLEQGDGRKFLLQQINNDVFKDVDGLMKNIEAVTEHIKKKTSSGKVMSVIKDKDGKPYININGEFFRVYSYIDNSFSYNTCQDLGVMTECGRAFGIFQDQLSDFDAEQLVDTIPNFHNTYSRFKDLKASFENGIVERKYVAGKLYEDMVAHQYYAKVNVFKRAMGDVPIRVTHNDPKLNNTLFDKDTRKCCAVVDLDTVMKGIVADDFGDAVRSACNTVDEEEKDITKVQLDLRKFESFTEGFLSVASNKLTRDEIDSLTDGAICMTYELAMRFLTDYLNGDKYFKVNSPNENLHRAQIQYALAKDMMKKKVIMQTMINEIAYSKNIEKTR